MTIATRLGVFFLLAGLLLCGLVTSIALAFKATLALNQAQTERFTSYQLADELRRSSDDLTRMVRSYVVTGDRRYYHYFQQIHDIRNGTTQQPEKYNRIYWHLVSEEVPEHLNGPAATPLIQKIQAAEFTDSELSLLAQAKRESDALVRIEDQAMLLMDKYHALANQQPPNITPALQANATQLVFNRAYHDAKARIMKPIQLFYESVDTRTALAVKRAQHLQHRYFILAACVLAASVAFSIYVFVDLRRQFAAPLAALLQWVQGIESARFNFPKASNRTDELGQLENAFIRMATKINAKITALQEMAGKDTLTGAANLRRGRDYFQLCARAAERNGSRIALVFLDFNDFKPINDTYGHAAGDKVLCTSVKRLQEALRSNDMVCRIGGDEFVIILPDHTITTPTEKIVTKLTHALSHPIEYKKHTLYTSASLGVALFPDQGRNFDQLIATADHAMYTQKNGNKKAPAGALGEQVLQGPSSKR
ncbi:diguanylate cyclase [Simiduia sp. 21SJ11W-1]|uniref:putative bifunctional diguanylate cyclase/phosphodiesterase n=1 Tax=Simiduia sp. 21SJ11W-1 TaxID=2909669 RepID=UPI00209E6AF3|nr:diguanylate cyclase [Simiduia sp. 21SJ11W-1]UTA49162.1 diguanylate cyclase [Simiduia sp. 21SJ11W-1]